MTYTSCSETQHRSRTLYNVHGEADRQQINIFITRHFAQIRGVLVNLHWNPARHEVFSNEIVDKHAKNATQADFLPKDDNRYVRLTAATKRRFHLRYSSLGNLVGEKESRCCDDSSDQGADKKSARKLVRFTEDHIISHASAAIKKDLPSIIPSQDQQEGLSAVGEPGRGTCATAMPSVS